tara:strand:- start:365 stop:1042 length:678 start_codon:yes stop_codon:yes gene_type:complete
MSTGWIKLHRQLLEWEWYDDTNTKCLFLHCLLRANHSDTEWRGHNIKRGQFLTSVDTLTRETGLSVSQIRTSLKKLISTNEIASKSQARSTVITVLSYDSHQDNDKPVDKLMTMKSQADDNEIATDKNVIIKECKNDKKITRRFTPPTDIETVAYFVEKGSTNIEAEKFWLFYDSKNWFVGKTKMKKWQSAASGWITRNKTDNKNVDILKLSAESNWEEGINEIF